MSISLTELEQIRSISQELLTLTKAPWVRVVIPVRTPQGNDLDLTLPMQAPGNLPRPGLLPEICPA